jgi:hypothetical protein
LSLPLKCHDLVDETLVTPWFPVAACSFESDDVCCGLLDDGCTVALQQAQNGCPSGPRGAGEDVSDHCELPGFERERDDKVGRAGEKAPAGGVCGTPNVRFGRMHCSGITALTFDADWQWLNRRERLAQSVMAWLQVYERLGARGEQHRPITKIVLLDP